MRILFLILTLLTTCLLSQAGDRPNVVFILSDDQSWDDYGFMGHPHIETPHLDQLAGEGLLYERGYTTAAICRPSLASIVTGLYPHQTGVRGNRPFMGEGVDHRRLRKNEKLWPLAQQQSKLMTATLEHAPSMVKQLQASGYATLQTGKWWEGNPLDHGFDEGFGHGIGRKTMEPIYRFVDQAQKNAQPFFIWYAVFLPHTPHDAPDRLYLKYKDLAPDESTARYWANVAWLDETCGQLVDHLKEKNLYDDTLFVFSADNGWRPDPEKVGWYTRSKKEPVEAGVRTPIFLTHKNKIAPRRDQTTLASNIDIAPTILSACGIEPDQAMSGLDLRDSEALAERDRIFIDLYSDNIRVDALEDWDSDLIARVVIDGWDKLIARPDSRELYDLKKDPDDRTDLAAQNPEKVKELSEYMNDWLEDTPVVFPTKETDEIVAADLLTIREPRSAAESQLRVIRLTTRGGAKGYGDYLDFGLPAKEAEETLARLVNRYAAQGHKQNIFMTDPSMRAVDGGHTVIGQTAKYLLNARTREWPGRALYQRDGFGPMWQGPGKAGLIIALQSALLDLAEEATPCQIRLCPSITIDHEADGQRRLCTPDEMHQRVASLKQAGFTAVRLKLAGALDDEMKARGECAPYRYPQEVLGQISQLVLAAKQAADPDMDITIAADLNLSTDGMTYLAIHCQRNGVTLLENPMALRHLPEQGEARKEFHQALGFGGDYHKLEDFAQGIKHQAGTVLLPDAGHIGGVAMLARTADLAQEAKLKIAPIVQGGPLSLITVARSLTHREEVLWITSRYQDEWLKADGVLKEPLQITKGSLTTESCEIDETKFQVKRIAELNP